MEKIKIIKKLVYEGEVDEQGRPHGKGTLYYVVEKDPAEERKFDNQGDLRYRGEFEHGLRQGDGDLHALGLGHNPVSRYAWYSEGEYDSCGRLIHPSNPEGSYQEFVPVWYPFFEGLWQADQPLKSRWSDDEVRLSELAAQYVRLTAYDAIKTLPFELKTDE